MQTSSPISWLYVGFNWQVDPLAAGRLVDVLGRAAMDRIPGVTIVLNSHGGSPEQALYVSSIIKGFSIPVHTHNASTVQSAGNVIYLAGHKRSADPNATFLFHETVLNAATGPMTKEQLASNQAGIRNSDSITLRLLAEVTGKPTAKLRPLLRGTRLHTAVEGKALGFVQEIVALQMIAGSRFVQVSLDVPKG